MRCHVMRPGAARWLLLAACAAATAALGSEERAGHDDPAAVYEALVAAVRGEGDPATLERHVDYGRLKRSLLETAVQCDLIEQRRIRPGLDVSRGSRAHVASRMAALVVLGPYVNPKELDRLVETVVKMLRERPRPAGAERVSEGRYEVRYRTSAARWFVALERSADDGLWRVTDVGRVPPKDPDALCVTPEIVPNPLYEVRARRRE